MKQNRTTVITLSLFIVALLIGFLIVTSYDSSHNIPLSKDSLMNNMIIDSTLINDTTVQGSSGTLTKIK